MYNEKMAADSSLASSSGIANSSKVSYPKADSNPVMAAMREYQMVYPEIFYKLQPYIMMICDQLDSYGDTMPNQEMIEQMTDNIYSDIMEMYPDIAEYVRNYESNSASSAETIARVPSFYRRRYRRRGLFRDLIDILFLSEFHRRRRRRYY